jgi:hypothetical protein
MEHIYLLKACYSIISQNFTHILWNLNVTCTRRNWPLSWASWFLFLPHKAVDLNVTCTGLRNWPLSWASWFLFLPHKAVNLNVTCTGLRNWPVFWASGFLFLPLKTVNFGFLILPPAVTTFALLISSGVVFFCVVFEVKDCVNQRIVTYDAWSGDSLLPKIFFHY